jgi:hypothetical protein
MSHAAFQWAKEQTCRGPAKTVLLLMADAANLRPERGFDGHIAWPSRATLAKWGGIDERTVRRAFRALEASGLITNLGSNHPGIEATLYRVNMTPAASQAEARHVVNSPASDRTNKRDWNSDNPTPEQSGIDLTARPGRTSQASPTGSSHRDHEQRHFSNARA